MPSDKDEPFYRKLLDGMRDGVYFVNRARQITYWSKGAERLTGFSAEEILGHCCADNFLMHVDESGQQLCMTGCPLRETMRTGKAQSVSVYMHHRDGHRVPVAVTSAPIYDEDGNISGAVEVFHDNSAAMKVEGRIRELERLAMLDELTQLANRRYLLRRIGGGLNELQRYNRPFGVLFMDVDHFKQFNDTYGHDVGDHALKLVARTLQLNARGSDVPGRWGGEEFLMLCLDVDEKTLILLAERLRMLIERSALPHPGQPLRVTVSIGATLATPEDDHERLILRADQLMYHSKSHGRNRVTAHRHDHAATV